MTAADQSGLLSDDVDTHMTMTALSVNSGHCSTR